MKGRVETVTESWRGDLKGVYLLPLGGAAVFMNENVCRTDTERNSACRRIRDQGSVNSQSLQESAS